MHICCMKIHILDIGYVWYYNVSNYEIDECILVAS